MLSIDPREALKETRRLLRVAKDSVWVRCNSHRPFIYSQPRQNLLRVILREANPHLQVRVTVGVIEREGAFHPPELARVLAMEDIANAIRAGGLRLNLEWSGCHGVIIDKSQALIARGEPSFPEEEVFLPSSSAEVGEYVQLFEQMWMYSIRPTLIEPLSGRDVAATRKVFVASELQWSHIIKVMAKEPHQLYTLSPRRFEELVANLLEREGMEVHVTPTTRDGGRDILAWSSTAVGRFLYLVECKRHSLDRPIGVGLVRQLYGVVEAERASGGIIVTTSRFTEAAWGFGGRCGTRMMLTDYQVLIDWLRRSDV